MKKLILSSMLAVLPLASTFAVADESKVANEAQSKTEVVQENAFDVADKLYSQKDYKQAFKAYEELSKKGDGKATYNLAVMYEKGQGVSQSDKKAIAHFEKSASQGFPVANLALAKAYSLGTHKLKADPLKFKNNLTIASNAGVPVAQYWLAKKLLEEDKPESTTVAIALLESLSAQNSLAASHLLALTNLKSKTPNADVKKALHLLESNAKKGYAPSIAMLGEMNWKGVVLQKNLGNAETYFKVLANNKYPSAADTLKLIQKEIAAAK